MNNNKKRNMKEAKVDFYLYVQCTIVRTSMP